MTVFLLLALAFLSGVDPRRVVLLAGAVYLPIIVAVLVALHWIRARPTNTTRAPVFCEGVASELRAGATLRDALDTAATSVGASPLHPGLPMTEVAAIVAEQFPEIEQEVRLTAIAASRSGSDAAALFDEIGSLALAQSEIRREISVATAPGKATASILIGAPVLYLFSQIGDGIGDVLASGEQRVAALLGLGLFCAGLAGAGFVLWRASR